MDAKDLRTETALGERNNDGSKYSQSGGTALHCDRNKSYQDIGSHSLAKVDVQTIRPCAVIGPDRIVPPPASSESYLKKTQSEPWPYIDNAYHNRLPPEYPHKLVNNFQNPARNISPRQTFQENMQRIMVPPSYNSTTFSEDSKYTQLSDRNSALHKNIKISVPPEAKSCDVPYNVYPKNANDQKCARISDVCLNTVKPAFTRTAPHGWPPNSVNIHPTRAYGAPELYPYQDYCAAPRPALPRYNRNIPEDQTYVYPETYYHHQEGNIRFKPYPPVVKDRLGHQRYDYIGNYSNTFHPPPAFHSHKYELQKPVPPHPYPPYPPIKYLDRPPDTIIDGYQRNQQGVYNVPYHNQPIHPNYAPVLGNTFQSKLHQHASDGHIKSLPPNKHDYESSCPKIYSPSENHLVNEMGRMQSMKGQVIMPNYPALNVHNIPLNTYYKKDHHLKGYEYIPPHIRGLDPGLNIHNSIIRHGPVYPSTTLAMSPTDSSGSTDTSHNNIIGHSQEDCGYASQSSTASVRSIDSSINRMPNEYLRKYYDSRYGPNVRNNSMISKSEQNSNCNSKEKKDLNVRQFLQMWNEGDEETEDNNSKEIIQTGLKNDKFNKRFEVINKPNQEQLYVLGLVNVPSEELGKYEHIQKVSKLPENIKGYSHIELLNQFEEAIESSNMSNYKTPTTKDYQIPFKGVPPFRQNASALPPRPLSPLDVEAKISQSIIHKEVGCNFEIKPCSPKMLNVEVATPVQNILERAIEKVANPVMLQSPRLNNIEDNNDCNINRKDNNTMNNEPTRIPSCNMVNPQFSNHNSIDAIKNSYSLHDLEGSSGLCLASLPRLDNDIELNFPEVNQQFINANKRDSISLTMKDLPILEDLDQANDQMKNKLNNVNILSPKHDVIKSPCFVDSEKEEREFLKLSKYRKSKTQSLDLKENVNATRTDSVIIKNPENSKKYEVNNSSPNYLNNNKDVEDTPINLTSQGFSANDKGNTPSVTSHENNETDISIDIAIDFSLSKTNSNDNFECKTSQTPNIMEPNNSMVDNHLNKDPLSIYCDQNGNSNPIENESNSDNLSGEIYDENKYLPAMTDVSEGLKMTSENKDRTPENNSMSRNILLPIEFMSTAECLGASYENDYDMVKNYKLDNQTIHEPITDTQTVEIFNKKSICDKAVESKLGIQQSNNRNLNHSDETSPMDIQDVKDSELQISDHPNHTGKVTEIEDHKTRNSLKTNITHNIDSHESYQTELIKDNEDLLYTNNSELKSTDEFNNSEESADLENLESETCADLKSPDNSNHTEQTIAIEDPAGVNSSYLKLSDDVNHLTQSASIGIPQNITCDDNYSEQPVLKATKIISETDNKVYISRNNSISSSDDIIMDSQDYSTSESKRVSESINNLEISAKIDDDMVSLNNSSTDYRNLNLNIPSPKNTLLLGETISSYEIDTQVVDNGDSNTTIIQDDFNFSVTSIDVNDVFRHNIDKHLRDNELNIRQSNLNNTTTCNSNDYQSSQITIQDNNDKVTIRNIANNGTTHLYDLLLPGDDTEVKITCPEKKNIDEATDVKVNASGVVTKNGERSFIPGKYISYGSKEMFSPQIQNLILFCEGVISAEKMSNNCSNYYAIPGTKPLEDKEKSSSCNNFLNGHCKQSKSKIDSIVDFVSSTIENNVTETISSSSHLILEHSNTGGNNINIKIEKDAINARPGNLNAFLTNKEFESSESGVQNFPDIKNVLLSSTSASIVDETINDMINSCDNLKSPETLEEALETFSSPVVEQSQRLSSCNELANSFDKQNIHETGMGNSVCSDKTHDLKIQCNSSKQFEEKIKRTKTLENVANLDAQIFCDVDVSILTDNQFTDREDTSEQNIEFHMFRQDEELHYGQQLSTRSNKDSEENDTIELTNEFVEKDNTKEFKCVSDKSEPVQVDKHVNDKNDIDQEEQQSDFGSKIPKHVDNISKYRDETVGSFLRQHIYVDENYTKSDEKIICLEDLPDDIDNKTIYCVETNGSDKVITNGQGNPECWIGQRHLETNRSDKILKQSEKLPDYSCEEKTCTSLEIRDLLSSKVPTQYNLENRKRQRLKRSLSDTALNIFNNNNENPPHGREENEPFLWPLKRKKTDNVDNDLFAQNLCSIIQSNRRNSVSTFYNEEDVSFCILIDNSCIIAEEENVEQENICYTEISEECLAKIPDDSESHEDNTETTTESVTTSQQGTDGDYSDTYLMQSEDSKLESWVENVGCEETIIDDDIAENVEISGPSSPKYDDSTDNDESEVFSSSEHTDKVKFIYGDKMCNDDAQFVQILYNTPQMDVNKTLIRRKSVAAAEYYDNDSLEKILSDPVDNKLSSYLPKYTPSEILPVVKDVEFTKDKELENISLWQKQEISLDVVDVPLIHESKFNDRTSSQTCNDLSDILHSCESSRDNVFSYNENTNEKDYLTSSSPEVSSTTSEDRNSAILLTITNYKGSRVSQINDIRRDRMRPSCKFTEDKGYIQSHINFPTHRPLLTKGAQKYIPPLKETIHDLKVKLTLPPHSLLKLKQLKSSKEQPKVYKQANSIPRYSKKPKPKFEDVLKNIDEIQFKMHKDKGKKSKKSVPKVVIKKNENGSHYASTSSRTDYNPDLTGRKWQPWVFIEKNSFIDKMAMKRKMKAIYSHRKKTYVLAEKFQKYKSVNDAKFIITPPVSDSPTTGLKYTIRLKHN